MQNLESEQADVVEPAPSATSRGSGASKNQESSPVQEATGSTQASTEPVIPFKKTLSQRSLGDMSLKYTPGPSLTPAKTYEEDKSSKNKGSSTGNEYQPRLTQYFKDDSNSPRGKPSSSSSSKKLQKKSYSFAYCSICGFGAGENHPLIRPCDCKIHVHSDCLLAQITRHKSIRCIHCDNPYNVRFQGLQPIWKWKCPTFDPQWVKCVWFLFSWCILLTCIVLLLAGPLSHAIELDKLATIILSVMLLILMAWCVITILRIGSDPLCFFCQAFCLTNQRISVSSKKDTTVHESSSSTESLLLQMITGSGSGRTTGRTRSPYSNV